MKDEIRYAVEIWKDGEHDLTVYRPKSAKKAIEVASRHAKNVVKGYSVYVRWFRDKDGCRGFLNRSGHDSGGLAW